jgi:outer membrane protein TolC
LFEREVPARDVFDQALAQYPSVATAAFRNVGDCVTALQTDAVALQKAVSFEEASRKTLNITQRRLQIGDINYLELLNAQRIYQRAPFSQVSAQSNRLADTAALFQALGGGWWNRVNVEPANPGRSSQHQTIRFIKADNQLSN